MAKNDPEQEWQDTLAKIKNPTAREFMRKGREFMQRSEGRGFAMKRDSAEFKAWSEYFDRMGWRPAVMVAAMKHPGPDVEVTMPTQWPQWFDSSAA